MPFITTSELIATITMSMQHEASRYRYSSPKHNGYERSSSGRDHHRHAAPYEHRDRKNRGQSASFFHHDITELLPDQLRAMFSSLLREQRNLTIEEKDFLLKYLQDEWERIKAENPQLYFTSSDINPYKLNIALAKLLFKDDYVQTLLHNSGIPNVSFHTLLIPSAINMQTSSLVPFDDNLQGLYYLDDYIVTTSDILQTLNIYKIFANPYNKIFVLPDWLIAKLCQDVTYRNMIASTIFPIICDAYGIDPEIYQALPRTALKQLISEGDYSLPNLDNLVLLHQTLLPACNSADTVENIQRGIETFHDFKSILTLHPDAERILSLRNYVNNKTIGAMMLEIETDEVCLSETADNMCRILLYAIQILNVFRFNFGATVANFPDTPIAIPEPEENFAAAANYDPAEEEEHHLLRFGHSQ